MPSNHTNNLVRELKMNNLNNLIWPTIFIVIVASTLNLNRTKYQVASFGSSGAIIIDQQSGEAWVTHIWNASGTSISLQPIGYDGTQEDFCTYKPDDRRNNENATWWLWLKKKFSLKTYN